MNEGELREELENHKYFKRLFQMIDEHPHWNEMNFLHSSLIVKGGRILSYGINKPVANAFAKNYAQHKGWQIHSECTALYKVREKNLKGATMYNARIDKNGEIKISRPCSGCIRMLSDFEISKVVFTTNDGFSIEKIHEMKMELAA